MLKLFINWEWLGGVFVTLAVYLGAHFAPIWPFVSTSILLVVIDHIIGVRASVRRGETITSGGYKRTVEKGLLYFLFILAGHQITVTFSIPYVVYLSSLMVARVEYRSINENLKVVTGVTIWESIRPLFDLKNPLSKK